MAILDQEKSLEERLSKIIKESSNQDEDARRSILPHPYYRGIDDRLAIVFFSFDLA
jgi:hypothetical protein